MKLVLLDNVKGIGRVGDIKDVSDGYARNFLLPRGLGKRVTDGVIKEVAGLKTKKLEALSMARAQSVELAGKLAGVTIVLHSRANEKGTLFSGITESEIADALSTKAGAHIPASAIALEGHIKSIGAHSVTVRLADDVSTDIVVDVQPTS